MMLMGNMMMMMTVDDVDVYVTARRNSVCIQWTRNRLHRHTAAAAAAQMMSSAAACRMTAQCVSPLQDAVHNGFMIHLVACIQ
jgi:hypothetical protein